MMKKTTSTQVNSRQKKLELLKVDKEQYEELIAQIKAQFDKQGFVEEVRSGGESVRYAPAVALLTTLNTYKRKLNQIEMEITRLSNPNSKKSKISEITIK